MRDVVLSIADILRKYVFFRRGIVIAWHIVGIAVAYIAAFELRFDGNLTRANWIVIADTAPVLIVLSLIIFAAFRMFSGLWSYFSLDDLVRVGIASATTTSLFAFIIFFARGRTFGGFPRSVFILLFMMMGLWAAGGRLIVRFFREYRIRKRGRSDDEDPDRMLIVGNLADCDLILRCAKSQGLGRFVGMVCEDVGNSAMLLHGLPVQRSELSGIGYVAKELDANCILILPPYNKPLPMDHIIDSCMAAEVACQFRQIPSLRELATGQISAPSIKDVSIEDLLCRGQQHLDRSIVTENLMGKKVMVTGAGGSIGSELCRQIAQYKPEVIVLFELNEFALYTIEKDIKSRYPHLNVIAFAGDIRHPEEVETAIEIAGGIDTIYHAAAYKHVPLMEENVAACFRNNVLGTKCLAEVAELCHVKRFVMISSDKAVRPSNIMGATKRVAERIISERRQNGTAFVAVRFGNVLGSSGSVIPLFKKQIAAGGPVTVTSPDIRRFFMTIPEAVDLVLQAGAIGQRGEVMVLEMGEPVKIVDLARRLIELSGLVPDRDIKIEFTGLRPGEKEYEEIMTEDEDIVKTPYDKIWIMGKKDNEAKRPPVDIERVELLVTTNDEKGLRELAHELVPENTFRDETSSRKPFKPEKTRELVRRTRRRPTTAVGVDAIF